MSARRLCLTAICLLSLSVCAGLSGIPFMTTATVRAAAPTTLTSVTFTPAAATEAFGLDLLGARRSGNLVVSPDSVATALAMAGTGAVGRTAEQMAETLRLSGPDAFDSVGDLQRAIEGAQASAGEGHSDAPTLAIANGLFLQRGFPLKPAFVGGLQEHFGAAPEAVDFAGDASGALETINAWTSDHTNGIIPELFTELPEETRLVLADAVYLKAEWRHRFDPADTSRAPFHGSSESTSVEFMHQTRRLLYGADPGYKAIELPYRASTLSLLVVLPVQGSVAALQRQLDETGLSVVVHGLARHTVKLSLPRFHLNTRIDLIETLEALGMTAPFGGSADFSGITAGESLRISAVEHVADLGVDEEGTVAAAATGVAMGKKSLERPRDAVTLDADRPFLFFVRDDETGAVLFAGRLTDPAVADVG